MKKILYILMIFIGLTLTSCDDWLDINTNPDLAREDQAAPEQRLPSILAQFADAYESTGTRTAFLGQQITATGAVTGANAELTRWNVLPGRAAWPYQAWYVNCASNLEPLIAAAEKTEAYHYIGVAKVMKAWGYVTLVDVFGMLPYKEAFNPAIFMPAFDDAEYIYTEALKVLDEGIADLQKTQGSNAPELREGDILNGGNVDSWIKLANGLKARFLVHLTKKSSYNPDAVLAALANAPKTMAESSIFQYIDESPNTSAAKEALQYTNNGTSTRYTKLFISYLDNTYPGARAGADAYVDPRIDLIVPSFQGSDGKMVRSQGVDMTGATPNPVAFSYFPAAGKYGTAISGTDVTTTPDTVFVPLRKATATDGRITSTGTWYTARNSKGLFLTHAEMYFIEAEVKLRKSDASAWDAYIDGIEAHMEILGVPAGDVAAYIASPAVAQSYSELTMSDIMIQKFIALLFSPEAWVDLRRHNYSTDASGNYDEVNGVYKGFKRPSHAYAVSYPSQTDWPRRFSISSYTANFNPSKALEKDPDATKNTYLSKPIWWDMP